MAALALSATGVQAGEQKAEKKDAKGKAPAAGANGYHWDNSSKAAPKQEASKKSSSSGEEAGPGEDDMGEGAE